MHQSRHERDRSSAGPPARSPGELLAGAEVNGYEFDIEPLLRDQDANAARVWRTLGLIEFHFLFLCSGR
jgi:hypothetical protein